MSTLQALLLLAVIAADPLGPGDHTRKITVDGRERSYLVHVPPQCESKTPTPVVLIFHRGGSDADVMITNVQLNPVVVENLKSKLPRLTVTDFTPV